MYKAWGVNYKLGVKGLMVLGVETRYTATVLPKIRDRRVSMF